MPAKTKASRAAAPGGVAGAFAIGAVVQARSTGTCDVWRCATLNDADPAQVTPPPGVEPEMEIWAEPTGRSPTVKVSAGLFSRLTEPVRVKAELPPP